MDQGRCQLSEEGDELRQHGTQLHQDTERRHGLQHGSSKLSRNAGEDLQGIPRAAGDFFSQTKQNLEGRDFCNPLIANSRSGAFEDVRGRWTSREAALHVFAHTYHGLDRRREVHGGGAEVQIKERQGLPHQGQPTALPAPIHRDVRLADGHRRPSPVGTAGAPVEALAQNGDGLLHGVNHCVGHKGYLVRRLVVCIAQGIAHQAGAVRHHVHHIFAGVHDVVHDGDASFGRHRSIQVSPSVRASRARLRSTLRQGRGCGGLRRILLSVWGTPAALGLVVVLLQD
mmetsp:Transcript_63183/g.100302  ORF Transcript_63183/g.100302 Transcript_63183/m.100302 type:complete len:285 (-) Transcript_63183:499-1353(-)